MSEQTTVILTAIEATRSELLAKLEPIAGLVADHESRLRKTETTITRVKTIGGIVTFVLPFLGWETFKKFLGRP